MKQLSQLQTLISLELLVKVLIGLQILAGLFLIMFTSIGQGLLLFGQSALIYLGLLVVRHLDTLRELLSYSLLKNGASVETPHDAETAYRSTRPTAYARGDELRRRT